MDNNSTSQEPIRDEQTANNTLAASPDSLHPSISSSATVETTKPKESFIRKHKWVVLGTVIVIILVVLIISYLVLRRPKRNLSYSVSNQQSSGINNLSQLRAARNKLSHVVQPVSNDTSKLNSLK